MSKPALWRRVQHKDGAPVVLHLPAATTLLVVPLIAAGELIGLLMLHAGHASELLHPAEQQLIAGFCRDSLVACQVAQARDDALQAAVHADRARVANDLNDHVVGQLQGVALELASLNGSGALPPVAQGRVEQVADALDRSIRDLRTALFSNRVSHPSLVVIPSHPTVSRLRG